MIQQLTAALLLASLPCAALPSAALADPWADHVIVYEPGDGIGVDFASGDPFSNVLVSLGEPTRFTSDPANFGGAVTPFNSPFRSGEVVSIGRGGSLTVSFDEPVEDHPLNPYGIDLLIFSNTFYFDASFPDGIAGTLANEGGVIEVSQDGIAWHTVPGVEAEGLFPTLGYLDLPTPFESTPGSVPTDFTMPVDPAFDPSGLAFADIVAGYGRSGGGAGVDLASVGLSQISYVRVSNPLGATFVPEIDAFADVRPVPEPAALALLLLAAAGLRIPRDG